MIELGLHVAKRGFQALRQWEQLPDDERAQMMGEAAEVQDRLSALTGAVVERSREMLDARPDRWKELLELAVHPDREFAMAQRVVSCLRGRPAEGCRGTELAAAVGAENGGDATFQIAVHMAQADGYIEPRSGGVWGITAFADGKLNDSKAAIDFERRIAEYVETAGIAQRDEIAAAVGTDRPNSVEFLAGLERAMAHGLVRWLSWSTYGLPPDKLAGFGPPSHPADAPRESGAATGEPYIQQAALALGGSLGSLAAKVARLTSSGGLLQPRTGQAPDPVDRLRKLADLHASGALTDAEFEQKKAELLARI